MADENWRDALPEEIRGNASLANFQDVGQMANSFIEMKSFQGNSIHIPGEDAGEEDKAKFIEKLLSKAPNLMAKPDFENEEQTELFFRTLGVPEKADGYDLPEVKMPDGSSVDNAQVAFLRDFAKEANLTNKQFGALVTKLTEKDMTDASDAGLRQEESIGELNKEWGLATEERIKSAVTIAEKTRAPAHVIEAIKGGKMPVDMLKWMHGLSVSIGGEGNNLGNLPPSGGSELTPGEATTKINEIYANREHAFHKGDKGAMEDMLKLIAAADPTLSKDIGSLKSGVSFT